MKKFGFVMGVILFLCVSHALGGDIKGNAGGKPGAAVVVWVEGVKRFQIPHNRPSISQIGTRFSPAILVIVAGQTVEMPNDDNVAHNIFSYSPAKQFNLGIYPKGESRTVTFTKPGVVDLFCSIHRRMNAKLIIVPNPFFNQADGGGSYRITSVPAGKYVVKMWSEGMGEQSKTVNVPAKGEVTLDF
jgi:plastocyanin